MSSTTSKSVITAITQDGLQNHLAAHQAPLVVKFWAPWCKPCVAIAPAIEKIAQALIGQVGFVGVNLDENPQTPAQYQVCSIPTLLLFNSQGKMVERMIGSEIDLALLQAKAKALC